MLLNVLVIEMLLSEAFALGLTAAVAGCENSVLDFTGSKAILNDCSKKKSSKKKGQKSYPMNLA